MELIPGDSFRNLGTIPFRTFLRECSNFNLLCALKFLQKEAAVMKDQVLKRIGVQGFSLESGHVYVSPQTIAFIAKCLLLNSSFVRDRPFEQSDYERLAIYFNHLETHLNYVDPNSPEAQLWLLREAYAQGRYQRIPNQTLGRYYILFRELERNEAFNSMVREAAGLDVTEIMLIGTCFYATLLQNGYLSIKNIESHTIPQLSNVLQPSKIRMFLNLASISQDRFKDECKSREWDNPLFKKYEFNPLWLYPIIDTRVMSDNLRYMVPSLNDLVYRFTEGIYYSTMEHFRRGEKRNDFSTEFGSLFEKYVGYLLQDVKKVNRLLGAIRPEAEYKIGKNTWKSADWLMFTPDAVVQVECKKLTTSNEFRAAISDGSRGDFNAVLDRFADYVVKLHNKATHISQGQVDLSIEDTPREVFSVFVVMDDFYLIDSRFKDWITAKATQSDQVIPRDFRYHILSSIRFEVLCEFLKSHTDIGLSDLLRLKEQDPNYSMSFDQFLEQRFDFQCTRISALWEASEKLWASVGLPSV